MTLKHNHLIGVSQEQFTAVPSFPRHKIAKCRLNDLDKMAITEEAGNAINLSKLDLSGTHYEQYEPNEIELMMGF